MELLIVALFLPVAAYRLTRLITKDTFPPVLWVRDRLAGGYRKPTRAEMYHESYPVGELEAGVFRVIPGLPGTWTLDHEGEIQVFIRHWNRSPHWLAELLSCPWCASAYVSAALTVYGALLDWYTWPVSVVVWLYVWGVASVVASKEWA